MKKNDIPKEILHQVEDELLAGERLLWVGQPKPRHMMLGTTAPQTSRATAIASASMLLGLFALFYVGGTSGMSAWGLIGGILAIIALIIGISYWGRYQLAQQTVYAITNRRALIINNNDVRSFGKNDLQSIERKMHRDDTGDIYLRTDYVQRHVPVGMIPVKRTEAQPKGFVGIENPQTVEALILETFHSDTYEQHERLMATDDEADYTNETELQSQAEY